MPEKIKYHCVMNELEKFVHPNIAFMVCFYVLMKPNKLNDINVAIDTILINSLVTYIPINFFYIYLFPLFDLGISLGLSSFQVKYLLYSSFHFLLYFFRNTFFFIIKDIKTIFLLIWITKVKAPNDSLPENS